MTSGPTITTPTRETVDPTGPRRVPELDPKAPTVPPIESVLSEPHWHWAPDRPSGTGPDRTGRTGADLIRTAAVLVAVLGASVLVGHLTRARGEALLHNRLLPWILGRGLGVAAYLALTGTVVLGLWLRHPWRLRVRRPPVDVILWAHVALAAGTVTLVAGHVAALALDRYAGVGWTGALVPWGAHFKPTPVALGTIAAYGLVLVMATAALAGSIGRAVWFPIHSASVLVFCITLAHGATAGSDGSSLRWVYACTGLVVVGLQGSRWVIGRLARRHALADR